MTQGQHVISPDVQDLHLLEHVTLVAMCASSSPLIHCSENDGCGCSWIIAWFIVDQVLDYMTVFFVLFHHYTTFRLHSAGCGV